MNRWKMIENIAIVVFILPLLFYTAYAVYREQSSYFPLTEVTFQIGNDDVQNISLWRNEEDEIYYAFLPTETEKIEVRIPLEKTITLEKQTYSNGDYITGLEMGEIYSISLNSKQKRCLEKGNVIFLLADSVPTMYITAAGCYNTSQMVEGKEDNLHAEIDLYNTSGNLDINGSCIIKGRGNTSWKEEKKPYNINFDEEVSPLGMNGQKKWALIANSSDPSLLRNKIAYTLAEEYDCPYTPQLEYVNVYVNGYYQGIYLLAQRISVEDGCMEWDDAEQNYLFEIDGRYEEEKDWFIAGVYGIVYSSNKFIFDESIKNIEKDFSDMLDVFAEEDSERYLSECSKYIDIDSWIKQYMISEFLVNADLDCASQYFFSEGQGKVLYAGPIWDYDNSMGVFHTMACEDISPYLQWAKGREGSWFDTLMEHKSFREKYVEYYENIFSDMITDMVENKIPMYAKQIDTSTYMDSVRWLSSYDTFQEDTEQIIRWLSARKAFYDEYWNNTEQYVNVWFSENGWKDYVYCIKRGENLDYYPQSYLYGKTVWTDKEKNIFPLGTEVTDDIKLYPLYVDFENS